MSDSEIKFNEIKIETNQNLEGNSESVSENKINNAIKNEKDDIFNELRKEIWKQEQRGTQIISVFSILFTFISLNISIFSKIDNLISASWFIILITIMCLIILSTGFIIIQGTDDDRIIQRKNSYIIPIAIFVILIILLILLKVGIFNPVLSCPNIK